MSIGKTLSLLAGAYLLAMATASAQTPEKIRVVSSFAGLWDTSQPVFCKEKGAFAKAGLDVEVNWARGGSETVQAVIAGNADIAYSPGTNAVLAAALRGAKIKIVGAQFTGQAGAFFYVPAASPIRSISDLNGKTVAYPRPGGAMESLILALKNDNNLSLKPVATGAMDATHTMVMTGQIDVGYAVVPSFLDKVEDGTIRVLLSSDQILSQQHLTGRVNIASAEFLAKRREAATRFFEVLDKCIDDAYADLPNAIRPYAAMNRIDDTVAQRAIAFYKREYMAFGPLQGLDTTIAQAVKDKFIDKAPTADQIAGLTDIVYVTPPR
jgi:NitT/TauT family transport system substrate-binding protein